MTESAAGFRRRLRQAGLSESAISAAWPEWWSDSADASLSARTELRFSVARKLGLDVSSLLEEGAPRFVWDDSVKYKGFRGDASTERPAISSFGTASARLLLTGTSTHHSILGESATSLRQHILKGATFVELRHLLALLWGVGIPVVHLRVYPLAQKRMVAMTARLADRFAILLARDATYPAPILFNLAHEIGHICLNHVKDGSAIIDMDDATDRSGEIDSEEAAADAFALELLTGFPKPEIEVQGQGGNARELANQALSVGPQHGIEPGVLALCYGFASGNWAIAMKSLKKIYSREGEVWKQINRVASRQLEWVRMTDESSSFVRALIGGTI